MTEIINFNKRRKAKLRSEKEVTAAQNRQKYGRTKQEKLADQSRADKLAHHLESHKRETTED